MSVILLILGILLFIGLVVVHEFGHFIVARRNGVEVEEFGIGFPPRAWGRKTKSGFDFTLNWLPLGGFVKLKGEHDADDRPGSFGAASLNTKAKIMLAGVGMNLLAAFVLLTILAWAGMPQLIDHQFTIKSDTKTTRQELLVGAIESGSPAAHAGLKARDRLVGAWTDAHAVCEYPPLDDGLDCQPPFDVHDKPTFVFRSGEDLTSFTKSHAGQSIVLLVERHGVDYVAGPLTLRSAQVIAASQKSGQPQGYLGVAPTDLRLTRSTWSAPIVAAGLSKQFTVLTFKGLGSALKGLGSTIAGLVTNNKAAREAGQSQASAQVSGPVGIIMLLRDSSLLGAQFVLLIIALISLTLAIMNVLPIPALDGGRLFLLIIARALHKPLTEEIEERVVGASFVFLLLLVALVTVVDVKRFF